MDKRSEARIPAHIKFVVHVHECKEEPALVGTAVECEAVDFSPHGLQFKTNKALHPKSLLNVTIGIGDPFVMFDLQGEVRWVRNVDGDHAMGILLREIEGTHFERWQTEFDSIFS